jgi:hypothetical protein
MNFERTNNPLKSLDIGKDRMLKIGDSFTVHIGDMKVPVVATSDETRNKHFYMEKTDCFGQKEYTGYEVRQVGYNGSLYIGIAEWRENCEHPKWEHTDHPEDFRKINPEDGSYM